MPHAAASTRAIDNVAFSLGLVNIPMTVYGGIWSDHGIHRKRFIEVPVLEDRVAEDGTITRVPKQVEVEQEDGTKKMVTVVEDHPVGNMNYDKVTGEPVGADDTVINKIETENGFVAVGPDEEEDLFTLNPKTITVLSFQPIALFHQGYYVPRTLYYLEPTKIKQGSKKVVTPITAQAFSMLMKAMREEGAMAVVEFTTRGVPKPAVLLPDATLWIVYHTDAVREQRELAEVELNEQAITMGRTLIQQNWSTEPLDLTDRRSELILGFANEKAAAGDFGTSVDTFVEAEPAAATDDFMALLQASVDQAKAAREEAAG